MSAAGQFHGAVDPHSAGSATGGAAATPVIELRGVSFRFDHAPILDHVDLAIAPLDFACLVGPNGGGKTTLLRLMLGLLSPTAGTIRIFGQTPAAARRRIGYMPQRTELDPQFPVTVLDVVLMGRLGGGRLGWYRAADRRVAREALRTVRLEDCAARSFSQLSGGQRQRVLIARALACEPEILLLDEPTANLDPAVEDELYDLLSELSRRMTIILVSHDVGVVSKIVRTVVCVNRRVMVHSTSRITPELLRDLYGHDIELVLHDHAHDHNHSHGHTHDHGHAHRH